METCRACGRTKENHGGLRHIFTTTGGLVADESGDDASSGVPPSQKAPGDALRGDPVMRLLLIQKGLITIDELTNAEDQLRTTGAVIVHSTRDPRQDNRAGQEQFTQGSLWGSGAYPSDGPLEATG